MKTTKTDIQYVITGGENAKMWHLVRVKMPSCRWCPASTVPPTRAADPDMFRGKEGFVAVTVARARCPHERIALERATPALVIGSKFWDVVGSMHSADELIIRGRRWNMEWKPQSGRCTGGPGKHIARSSPATIESENRSGAYQAEVRASGATFAGAVRHTLVALPLPPLL